MSPHAAEFLDKFFDLFFPSFATNILVGILCGLIGLFIVLRHMVFVSAALSQVAGAGLALAFWLGALAAPHGVHQARVRTDERLDESKAAPGSKEKEIKDTLDKEFQDLDDDDRQPRKSPPQMHAHHGRPKPSVAKHKAHAAEHAKLHKHHERDPEVHGGSGRGASAGWFRLPPWLVAVLLTVLVAVLLSQRSARGDRTTEEAVVGMVFILGSALAIIFAQMADKGAHEIQDFLFGMAVLVPKQQQIVVPAVGVVAVGVYVIMFKDFVFVSFDPLAARAARFPVGLANAVLFIVMAVIISVCTRAVGAMPVFALTVLPPAAALKIHERILPAAFTSAAIGGAAAGVGYFGTGLLELPAGPSIVLAATVPVMGAWVVRAVQRKLAARAERESAS
jgi:zinc transport system permease protein